MPTRTPLLAIAFVTLLALVIAVPASSKSADEKDVGYRYSIDWTSVNTASWQEHLGGLAGRADARGLEIGCFEGRSTLWFLEHVLTHPDARMACVDVFTDEIEANFDHNVKLSGQQDRVDKYKGYSQDVLRALEYESYDFVYIDGCHLASCALADAVLSWDLLRKGGFMIFDDYLFKINAPPSERPKIAVDAFLEAFIDQLRVHRIDTQVIIEKTVERGDDALVGNPVVHQPGWLKRLRQMSEHNRKQREREAQK